MSRDVKRKTWREEHAALDAALARIAGRRGGTVPERRTVGVNAAEALARKKKRQTWRAAFAKWWRTHKRLHRRRDREARKAIRAKIKQPSASAGGCIIDISQPSADISHPA